MVLPIEIIQHIASMDPAAYIVLISTCKAVGIGFPLSAAGLMHKFATQRYGRPGDLFPEQLAWRLPNGYLHCIDNNTPTIIFDMSRYKPGDRHISYHDNIVKRKYWLTLGEDRSFGLVHNDKLHYYYNKLHRDKDLPAIYGGIDDPLCDMYYVHGVFIK